MLQLGERAIADGRCFRAGLRWCGCASSAPRQAMQTGSGIAAMRMTGNVILGVEIDDAGVCWLNCGAA